MSPVSLAIFVVQAALCCIRILRHLPEHVEDFMERIKDVLKDRHHGVLVAGVQLITAVVGSNPKVGALPRPFSSRLSFDSVQEKHA